MTNSNENPKYEVDLLKYRGNAVPKAIKLIWIIMAVAFFYYMFQYSLVDLKEWLKK